MVALAAAGLALAVVACRSSVKSSSGGSPLKQAQCTRAHGLANFPDPTTWPPPAQPPGSHAGNAVGIGGVYLVFPPQSPALNRAEAKSGYRVPRRTATHRQIPSSTSGNTQKPPSTVSDTCLHEDGEVSRYLPTAIGLLHPAGSSSAGRAPLSFNDEHFCRREHRPAKRGQQVPSSDGS